MRSTDRLILGCIIVCLASLALNCGLTEMLQRSPTGTATTEVADLTATFSATPSETVTTPEGSETETLNPTAPATPTPEPVVQPTPTATETPPLPAATSTDTVTPSPTPTDTPAPSPTETLPGLRIESFDVLLEDNAGGKLIRCTWDTSGATGVRLVLGTSHRFPIWQDGPADGTTTFEVSTTVYDRPDVSLTAFGEGGGEAIETVTLDWPCDHTYFFAESPVDVPTICPTDAPATRQGAQQPFQGGSMIWIPDVEGRDAIFALYDGGSWDVYDDTWDTSQPESDPALVPPAALLQPVRGFGKVWREKPGLQSRLNWATAAEVAVTVTYQRQMQESIGGVHYIEVAGGSLVRLTGLGGSGSTWTTLP